MNAPSSISTALKRLPHCKYPGFPDTFTNCLQPGDKSPYSAKENPLQIFGRKLHRPNDQPVEDRQLRALLQYKGIEGKRALVPQGVRAPFYSHANVPCDPKHRPQASE
jgi:hypothetical protein